MLQVLSSYTFIFGSVLFWAFVVYSLSIDITTEKCFDQVHHDALNALRFYAFATCFSLLGNFAYNHPYICLVLLVGRGLCYSKHGIHCNLQELFSARTVENGHSSEYSVCVSPTSALHRRTTSVPSSCASTRCVRFSATVSVHEHGLDVGDLRLTLPTTFARPTSHSGLPTTLTNEVIDEYNLPVLEDEGRRCPAAMHFDDKLHRLAVYAGLSRPELERRVNDYWHNHQRSMLVPNDHRQSDEEAIEFCQRSTTGALCDPNEIPRLFVLRHQCTSLNDAQLYVECQQKFETIYSQQDAHIQAVQDMVREQAATYRRIVKVMSTTRRTYKPQFIVTKATRTRGTKRSGCCLEAPKRNNSKRRMTKAVVCV